MRQSLTYGVLPDRKAFQEAFYEVCPNGEFKIVNDKLIGTVVFNEAELWYQVKIGANCWNKDSEYYQEWD